MLRLLRSEVFRLRRRWMPWILLLVIVAASFVFYTVIYVSANTQLEAIRAGTVPAPPGGTERITETLNSLRPDKVPDFGLGIVIGLGSVLLTVFAASHVGAEYGWGTLRTLLAHGAGRGPFLASKLLSLALFAVLFTLVGATAVIAASYVVSSIAGLATAPGVDLVEIARRGGRGLYTLLPYMGLASLIALWAKSGGAGIAAGLVIFFAEGLVSGIVVSINRDLASVVNYGLSRNVSAVQRAGIVDGRSPSAGTLPDPLQAAIVLGLYLALFIALAYWRLRSRDVTLS